MAALLLLGLEKPVEAAKQRAQELSSRINSPPVLIFAIVASVRIDDVRRLEAGGGQLSKLAEAQRKNTST